MVRVFRHKYGYEPGGLLGRELLLVVKGNATQIQQGIGAVEASKLCEILPDRIPQTQP
jgi:hypothetical protein